MPQTIEHLPNGLTLRQDDRFFKLGQDSVLLAAFARPRRNARVLDLGCGTGALSLLLYRPDLKITGLELQPEPLSLFRQSIADNGVDLNDVRCVGLASPGVIDGAAGVVVRWSNYDWRDKPLGPDLCEMLGKPVFVANDANAAALGEAKYGAGKMYQDSILLTLGTGVGSGIIIGGKIFEGFHGAGGEAGHMVIQVGGIPCGCGRRGCFEQYASATALMRDTKRAMFEHKDSAMWKVGDVEKVDGRTAFEAAKAGDAAAQEVIKNYVMYLGEGILNLVGVLRPQAILLGGGVSNQGETLMRPLRQYVSEQLYVDCERVPLAIVRATLGNDAGIYGAYALAAEQ